MIYVNINNFIPLYYIIIKELNDKNNYNDLTPISSPLIIAENNDIINENNGDTILCNNDS